MNLILAALVTVATITGAGMIVPQVIHLHRHRTTSGVSLPWVGVGIAMNIWWTLYAANSQLWGLLPVSITSAVFYTIIAWQCRELIGSSVVTPMVLGSAAISIAPMIALFGWGWPGAGLAIGLSYSVQFAPAAIEAITSTQLSGMSRATWIMAFVEAIIWVVYGVAVHDLPLLVGGTGGTIMSIIILVQLQRFVAMNPFGNQNEVPIV